MMPSLTAVCRALAVAAVALGGAPDLAAAQTANRPPPAGAPLKPYRKMLETMGYATHLSPAGGHFYIAIHGTYNYTIDFALSDDRSYLWVYSLVYEYSAAQLAQVNMQKLLEENDSVPEFFSLHPEDGGKTELFLQIALPLASVSPKVIRQVIDSIDRNLDADDSTWNPDLWPKAPAGDGDAPASVPTPAPKSSPAPAPGGTDGKQVPI